MTRDLKIYLDSQNPSFRSPTPPPQKKKNIAVDTTNTLEGHHAWLALCWKSCHQKRSVPMGKTSLPFKGIVWNWHPTNLLLSRRRGEAAVTVRNPHKHAGVFSSAWDTTDDKSFLRAAHHPGEQKIRANRLKLG